MDKTLKTSKLVRTSETRLTNNAKEDSRCNEVPDMKKLKQIPHYMQSTVASSAKGKSPPYMNRFHFKTKDQGRGDLNTYQNRNIGTNFSLRGIPYQSGKTDITDLKRTRSVSRGINMKKAMDKIPNKSKTVINKITIKQKEDNRAYKYKIPHDSVSSSGVPHFLSSSDEEIQKMKSDSSHQIRKKIHSENESSFSDPDNTGSLTRDSRRSEKVENLNALKVPIIKRRKEKIQIAKDKNEREKNISKKSNSAQLVKSPSKVRTDNFRKSKQTLQTRSNKNKTPQDDKPKKFKITSDSKSSQNFVKRQVSKTSKISVNKSNTIEKLNNLKINKNWSENVKQTKGFIKKTLSEKAIIRPSLKQNFELENESVGSSDDTASLNQQDSVKDERLFNWVDDNSITKYIESNTQGNISILPLSEDGNASSEFLPQIKNDKEKELMERSSFSTSEYSKSFGSLLFCKETGKTKDDNSKSLENICLSSTPPTKSGKSSLIHPSSIGEISDKSRFSLIPSYEQSEYDESMVQSSVKPNPVKGSFKSNKIKKKRMSNSPNAMKKITSLPKVASYQNKTTRNAQNVKKITSFPKVSSRQNKTAGFSNRPSTNISVKASRASGITVPVAGRTRSLVQFMRRIGTANKTTKLKASKSLKTPAFGTSTIRSLVTRDPRIAKKKKKAVKKKKKKGKMKPYAKKPRTNNQVERFKAQFRLFAKFGDRRNSGETISMANTVRWLKQGGIVGSRTVTPNDIEIYFIYTTQRRRSLKMLEFLQFLQTLCIEKVLNITAVVSKLLDCGPPTVSVTDVTIESVLLSENQDQVLPNIFAQPLSPSLPSKLAELPYQSSALARQLRKEMKTAEPLNENNRYGIPFPIPQVYFQSSGETLPLQYISYEPDSFVRREPIFMVRSPENGLNHQPLIKLSPTIRSPNRRSDSKTRTRGLKDGKQRASSTDSQQRVSSTGSKQRVSSTDNKKRTSSTDNKKRTSSTDSKKRTSSIDGKRRTSFTDVKKRTSNIDGKQLTGSSSAGGYQRQIKGSEEKITRTRRDQSGTDTARKGHSYHNSRFIEPSSPSPKSGVNDIDASRSWHNLLPNSTIRRDRQLLSREQLMEWKMMKNIEGCYAQGKLPPGIQPPDVVPTKQKKRRFRRKKNQPVETLVGTYASRTSDSTE